MAKFLGIPTSGSQGATTWGRNRYGQYTRMRAQIRAEEEAKEKAAANAPAAKSESK